jgi:phosphoribosylglycinamide formyltransferase-1
MTTPVRAAFLLSGSGTTLENLLREAEAGTTPVQVVVAVADRPGARGLEHARARGIPTAVVERRAFADQAAFDAAMDAVVRPHAPRLVLMGGFLSLWRLPADLRGRAMNVHPALLPAFGGRGFYGERVHRAVLEAGVKVTGCTVHFVDDEYDHGPIVAQAVVDVREDDTPHSLAHRVQEAERRLFPECVRLFAEGRLRVEGRRVRVLPPAPDGARG